MKRSIDIKEMARLYRAGRTVAQVGQQFGIPQRTAYRYLVNAGVSIRKRTDPKHEPLADKRWLAGQYLEQRKSTTQIAGDLDCGVRTVSWWLDRHQIPARTTGSEKGHLRNDSEEVRLRQSMARRGRFLGPEHPNWKGGRNNDPDRGRYPYKMWTIAVKDRDGWKCTECGSKDRLHAHHIKGWKHHPLLRYEVTNGATLCHICHDYAHGRFMSSKYAKRPRAHRPRRAA